MIYEYRCDVGHVIEAHVKLNGEGTPSGCTTDVPDGMIRCEIEGCDSPAIALTACCNEEGIPEQGICHRHSYLPHPWPIVPKPRVCARKLTRILSLCSPGFPGAGSWRGG